MENGTEIQSQLLKLTGQRTVPNIFVKGQHLGGCDDTLAAIQSGKFAKMLL
jgi:glutaredoxin 3